MTMSITMIQTRMGESGSLLTAGSTYSVGDAFGLAMIGAGYATDTNRVRRQPANSTETNSSYTAAQLAALATAGGLTPYATYVASDTGVRYTAGTATALYTEGFGWAPVIAQAQHLRRTAAKLANARNSPVVVNCFGHSIVDGGYANDVVASVDLAMELIWGRRGFPAVLRDLFATVYGTVAGESYCQASAESNRFTTRTNASAAGPSQAYGFGGYVAAIINYNAAAKNSVLTCSVTGTVARVRGMASASGYQVQYSIAAGAATSAPAGSTVQTPRANGFYWVEVDIPLGVDGTYTLNLHNSTVAGNFYLFDIRGISDTTKGVYVGRYGYSGACLAQMFAHALDATDASGPAWLSDIATTGWYDQQLQSVVGRSNALTYTLGTATMTIASPCVVSKATHLLNAGDAVQFTTTGALPTGLLPNVTYYVMSTALAAGTLQLAATPESQGGVAINTTGTQSGTHTMYRVTKGYSTDLAIIMCDANDSAGYTNYAYSLADVQRHAQNVANKLVALGVDVLFVTGPGRDAPTHPWTYAQNVAAYKAVADATDRVGHLDLGAAWADYNDGNANGLFVDYVHLSSTGHAFVGKSLYRALMAL